jgi:RNA polymerase sigma factor (sigma-70 family)
MSADLFRTYIDIINENNNPDDDSKLGPTNFQRSFFSGKGPQLPEPMEIVDDPQEITTLIHKAYNTPDSEEDPNAAIQAADVRKIVNSILLDLDPLEERLVRMAFGIGVPEMSLEQIGEKLGINRGGIRQRLDRALRKIRYRISKKSNIKSPSRNNKPIYGAARDPRITGL